MAYIAAGATRRGTTKGQPEAQELRIAARSDALQTIAERGGLVAPGAPWYKSTTVLVLGGAALLGGVFLMTRKRKGRR